MILPTKDLIGGINKRLDLRGNIVKTNRGFELNHFTDDYGVDCSLQESSAVEPHIWLGVRRPEIMIMYKDAVKNGMDLQKLHPQTSEGGGWYDIPIPEDALIASRMHLNRKQAKRTC